MPTFTIRAAPLPTNFKGTPQQLFEAMLDRMEVVSDGAAFINSDTEPDSNQGPWLKDGKQWWVWDENTSAYVPLDVSASVSQQVATGADEPDPNKYQLWAKTDGTTFVGLGYYMGLTLGWVFPPSPLQNGVITESMLQDQIVSRNKIKNGEVTIDKLANDLPFTKFVKGSALQYLRMDANGGVPTWQTVINVTSTQAVPTSAGAVNWDHSLGSAPSYVRVVLVCTDANGDAGFAQNDEINWSGGVSADTFHPTVMANATKIYVVVLGSVITVRKKDGSGSASLTKSKWNLKCYYANL